MSEEETRAFLDKITAALETDLRKAEMDSLIYGYGFLKVTAEGLSYVSVEDAYSIAEHILRSKKLS